LNADFDFFIKLLRILYVFVLDSVPEALINSSIFRGLPAEYSAASIRAVASFSSSIFTRLAKNMKIIINIIFLKF